MSDIRSQPQWSLWIWWVLVNIVGFGVGFGAGQAVFEIVASQAYLEEYQVGDIPIGYVVATVAMLTVFALSIGIAQWLVLRQYIPRAGWWVLATILGLGAGGAVSLALGDSVAEIPSIAILFSAIGIAQWLVLRQHLPRSGWWVFTSIVGFALALVVYSVALGINQSIVFSALGGPLGGAAYGAITGRLLDRLPGQSILETDS